MNEKYCQPLKTDNKVAPVYYSILRKIETLKEARGALKKINDTVKELDSEECTIKISKTDAKAIVELFDEIDAEYEQWVLPDKFEYRRKT